MLYYVSHIKFNYAYMLLESYIGMLKFGLIHYSNYLRLSLNLINNKQIKFKYSSIFSQVKIKIFIFQKNNCFSFIKRTLKSSRTKKKKVK